MITRHRVWRRDEPLSAAPRKWRPWLAQSWYNLPGKWHCYCIRHSILLCPLSGQQVRGTQGPKAASALARQLPQCLAPLVLSPSLSQNPSPPGVRAPACSTKPTSLQPGTMDSHGVHSVSYCGIKCHKVRTKTKPRASMCLLLPAGQRIKRLFKSQW